MTGWDARVLWFGVVLATCLWAQNMVSFIYLESFRKGNRRVTESSFSLALNPSQPTCFVPVKDAGGRDRYWFACAQQKAEAGDDRIIGWQVRLADFEHKIYDNLLTPTVDASQDATQGGWLDPGKFAKIPLTRERIIKVDGFYCVVQVKNCHFVSPEKPYLDGMSLSVHFTNTRPHSRVRATEEKTVS
jgi:hypothetical protein